MKKIGLILLFFVAMPLAAQNYTLLNTPQTLDNPNKQEVIEFFSFGCPHCAALSSSLNQWEKTLKDDVVLKRVPVSFGRAAWRNVAKMFYALEAINERVRLEGKIFNAIHNERVNLFVPKTMNEWLMKEGVDMTKFNAAFQSFGVNNALKRAEKMTNDYAIDGVPALVVNGKYLFSGATEQTLQEVNQLLEKNPKK